MKKISNWDKVIKYVNNNPDATVKEVATKVGITYSYAYKIMRGVAAPSNKENKIAPGAFIHSDGSTADYYKLPKDSKELQDLISHKDMNAQIGEIFRSCYRYGEVAHSKKLRDAKKIKFYAEAEIKRLEELQ
jgi:Flp pilus assembly CpaF family ATPase